MIGYKLTNQNMQTYNGFQWELNTWAETSGEGELCGPDWLHYYDDALLAVLLNPIHANIKNPRLFECEVEGQIKGDHGLKFGTTKMRLVKEIEVPNVTAEQRIRFAILCSLEVCHDASFIKWARDWLSNKDRSTASAELIRLAAESAKLAAWSASFSAESAAWLAKSAAWLTAWSVAESAESAAHSAELAIDLKAIARKAIEEER